MTSWLDLFIAILLESLGTTCMKFSQGFTQLIPSTLVVICYIGSISMLTKALKGINLNIAYAIWSGLGTAIIAIVGVIFFKETLSPLQIVSIFLIILGVVGVNLLS
ncbi:MAG: multidrug efflux SMR transporter [Microcoleus sp.]